MASPSCRTACCSAAAPSARSARASSSDDLLEAVIGLAPNLFYGTGIPACVLVLRAPGSKPRRARGKVLFINADREYAEGRAQNYLCPEHIEKIVSAWQAFEDMAGFARVVGRAELSDNDDNLNIRRYADNAPPPEPHDVRAHLHGGIPKAEVEAKAALFAAHGFDPRQLLTRSGRALPRLRAPTWTATADAQEAHRGRPGLLRREADVADAVEVVVEKGRSVGRAARARAELMARAAAPGQLREGAGPRRPARPLPGRRRRRELVGRRQNDLKTARAHGFSGVVDAWVDGHPRHRVGRQDRTGKDETRSSTSW